MSKFEKQYATLGMDVPASDCDQYVKAQAIYVAACKKLGIHPGSIGEPSPDLLDKYKAAGQAFYQLMIIRDALVDNREADWNDSEEAKYGAWFWMNDPGFRLSDVYYDYAHAYTTSGSRLCTFSGMDQQFFVEECLPLWAAFIG